MPTDPKSPAGKAIKARYRATHKEQIYAQESRRAARAKAWIDNLKSGPCMDCGNLFPPVCMDFDHRPDEVKSFGIALRKRYSQELLLKEIAKCDLVCSNCHRIRTEQRGYRR